MSTATKVAVFLVGLGVVFAAALGIGNAVGPVADEPVAHDDEHGAIRGATPRAPTSTAKDTAATPRRPPRSPVG